MTFRLLLILLLLPSPAPAQKSAAPAPPLFSISGTVVDARDGSVLPGSTVQISVSTSPAVLKSSVTDEDGRFFFSGLESGMYRLTAWRTGYSPQLYEGHPGYFTGIAVGKGHISEGLIFQLNPDGSICGTILDNFGEAVRRARVSVFFTGVLGGARVTRLVNTVSSDDRGQYCVYHLRPAKHYVVVQATPWYALQPRVTASASDFHAGSLTSTFSSDLDVAYPAIFSGGVTSWKEASPVQIAPGEAATMDFTLNAVPAVHARFEVHDPGLEARQVTLELARPVWNGNSLWELSRTTTLSAGNTTFEVSGIAPGEYIVTEKAGDKQAHIRHWVEISEQGDVRDLQQRALPNIKGKIVLEAKAQIPARAQIRLFDHLTGRGAVTEVAPDGTFDFSGKQLESGLYQVLVSNVPGVVVSVSARGAKVVGRSVRIGNTPADLIVHLSSSLGTITGTVARGGQPTGGVMVLLVPDSLDGNFMAFRLDQSNSDGSFALREVLPGTYSLLAIPSGWNLQWTDPAVLAPFLKGAQKFRFQATENFKAELSIP